GGLREPDVGFGEGELEVGWQNADDGVGQSSDVDGLPHDLRVAAEPPLPKIGADDGDRRACRRIFFPGKAASHQWLDAENRTKIRADARLLDDFGSEVASERNIIRTAEVVTNLAVGARGLLKQIEANRRHAAAELDDAVRIAILQRPQENCTDHREDRRG